MCRKQRFSDIASLCAQKSKVNFRHGAIITKNSKVIVKGFNDGTRTKILDQIHPCVHAEIDALHKLIQILKKKYLHLSRKDFIKLVRKNLKKYIIWVVRISGNKNPHEINYSNSIPCCECLKVLKHYGMTKVGFSDQEGNIVIKKIEDIKDTHNTSSNESYNKYMKYLKNMNV